LREGERLWDIEKDRDSVLTVGASQIFSQGCHTYGPDYLGQQMVHAGRQMAERLGLVGVPNDSPAAEALKRKPPDWKRMAAYVAWGCYSWFSYVAFAILNHVIQSCCASAL
jgi:coenzyme F420-reducing hydrogenase beta subunit